MKRGGGGGAHKKLFPRGETIPPGEILKDPFKQEWKLGKSIGQGGFGDIYLASSEVSKPVSEKTADYVVKIEPFMNGPLFVENQFYIRYAKVEMIQQWKSERKLDSLGMPCFVSSGQHVYKGQEYRFMVLPRYGQDLQKIIEAKPLKRLSCRSVQAIALQVLDVLEYIHSKGSIHGDVKASNLLLGLGKKEQVYLVDYGLALKYMNGDKHTEHAPDRRNAHNGTLEYTSRDAHDGCTSRRSDLEILGYNMLEWLCGQLPWSNKDPPTVVQKQKQAFMSNIQLKKVYKPDLPGLDLVEKYLKYVAALGFEEEPNYKHCREMLKKGLPAKLNSLYLNDSVVSPKKRGSTKSKGNAADESLDEVDMPWKKIKIPDDETQKRATRTTQKVTKFDWANVLSSNPEAIIRSASQNTLSNSPPENKNTSPKSPIEGKMTPAMLQILIRKKENVHSPVKGLPSPVQLPEGTSKLTPAMQEVLMRTKKKKLKRSLSWGTIPQQQAQAAALPPPAPVVHHHKKNGHGHGHHHAAKPLSPAIAGGPKYIPSPVKQNWNGITKVVPQALVSGPKYIPTPSTAAAVPSTSSAAVAANGATSSTSTSPPFIHGISNGIAHMSTRQARYVRRHK